MRRRNILGFTLIELMITVAIIAILASIAYPSYQSAIQKSRRADAHAGLIKMQLEQENFRMLNVVYASAFGINSNDVKDVSNDYYTFKISGTSASAYLLTATAKTGKSQASDSGCTEIKLDQTGTKTPTTCW